VNTNDDPDSTPGDDAEDTHDFVETDGIFNKKGEESTGTDGDLIGSDFEEDIGHRMGLCRLTVKTLAED